MKRFLLLLLFGTTMAIAQTTWTGAGANTNWNNTDNWDTNLVPTASDDVIIPSGFIVTLNVAGIIKSIDVQGNSIFNINTNLTFTDPSSLGVNAIVNWNSGALQGNGNMTNNGTINLLTASAKIINGTTVLVNEGVINFQSTGFLYLYGDSTLNNALSGVIDFQDNASLSYSGGGALNFNNLGTLKKTGGLGISQIQARLTNTGTISVESGTLTMNFLEKTFDGGIYNVTSGNTLLLSVNVNINSTLTGQLDGSFNLANNLTVATTAEFDFTGSSGFNWNSGSILGDGTLTNSSTINMQTASAKIINGTTVLVNEGVINFQSTGFLYLYGDSTLNNALSGVIDFQDNASLSYSGGGALNFNNLGTLKKTGGLGISQIQARLTNTGTISVESGTLTMNFLEKTFDGGVYNVTSGNTLLLSVNVNINSTLTGQLDGSFNLANNLTVATTAEFDFTGSSGFNWNSGSILGDGTLTNSSTINLQTTSAKIINGTTVLVNEGVINFQSTGFLYLYGDSTLNNALSGVIDFQDNASLSYSGGGTFSFSNAGLLTKTNIAGLTYIYPPTTNSGTIDVQSGEMEFIGTLGLTNTIDGIVKGIATIDLPPAANFANDGTFAPGASPGILTVIGDFKSSSTSVLDIELEGLTQGTEYDLLAITGTNVIFDGSVNIAMGFEANLGDEFTIATTTGTIATKNLTSPVIAVHEGKQYTFDITYPGDNSVLLTISDKLDIEPPMVITQNIIVQLDASGNASITTVQIDNGSFDNCTLTENLILNLDITDFTCSDLGDNTVSLTVTDEAGNFASANATVTVEDSIDPIVITQNITIQLDASGNASIVSADVNNGSSDNCMMGTFSLDITDFTCSDLGDNTVELTVTDQSGNTASASAIVTVEDSIDPIVITQNITIQLDASGNASIVSADVNNGSSDNCMMGTFSLDITDFTCSDLGDNTVELTVTDQSGNTASASAIVTVEDSIDPIVITQNITIQLDALGNASIVPADVNNGSSDNCMMGTFSLDITDFTCTDLGDNTVELTVTDQSGNSASASAIVTVEDSIDPIVITQNIGVVLDASGNASITAGQIDNGSTDNCSVSNLSLDITDFTCADLGDNTVEFTVTDQSGNSATATATVTVSDGTSPEIICPDDFTVDIVGGNYTVPNYFIEGDVTASDNCDNDLDFVQSPIPGTVLGIGEHTITVEVTDDSGQSAMCTFKVTVEDSLGVNDHELSENNISLFPNPATDKFTIKNNTNINLVSVVIVDIKGSIIQKIDLSNQTSDKTIEIQNYASGVYFVRINSETNSIVKRIVVSN